MIIITYSETANDSIENRLGKAEYSYYFIYKKYLPTLEKLGELVSVTTPATEVDEIFHSHPNDACVFLSFSPPHRTVTGLDCPTVCVFAWEFDTIPTQAWGDRPEMNWAAKLSSLGNALTLSHYAADVTRQCMDHRINLEVIPAPLDTQLKELPNSLEQVRELSLSAKLYDSRAYNAAGNLADNHASSTRDKSELGNWDGETRELDFGDSNPETTQLMVGFYSAEEWGAWSRSEAPCVLLPALIKGRTSIELELMAYNANIGRKIEIELGDDTASIVLSEAPQTYRVELNPSSPADTLQFSNLDLSRAPGARDTRSLGIGLRSIKLSRPINYRKPWPERIAKLAQRVLGPNSEASAKAEEPIASVLRVEGVVYSSVFNPDDGRKNWEDMVTAFCWAFKTEERATLVLKMSHSDLSTFLSQLLLLFSKLAPFKCRVVAVHGYLSEEELKALINATDYVVNSSLCEGQCLPLMEFMGYGVPAVSPNHTAMKDYVSTDNSLIVKSSLQPTFWPFDERMALQTLRYRINWDSLREGFVQSYDLIENQPNRYHQMCENSVAIVEKAAGHGHVEKMLKLYLENTAKSSSP